MAEVTNILTGLLSGGMSAGGVGWLFWWLFKRNQTATDRADANAAEALTKVRALGEALKGKKDIAVCEAYHKGEQQTLTQILDTVKTTQQVVHKMGERVSNIEGRLKGGPK